ncbi:MAG: dual specificity protein phosphatase family protein [Phycisphaeraceae bacterium]
MNRLIIMSAVLALGLCVAAVVFTLASGGAPPAAAVDTSLATQPGMEHMDAPGATQPAEVPEVATQPADGRPRNWGQAITDQPGLSNFHKIHDTLYRGAQPEDQGFARLRKMGVKTVINLRSFHSDRANCRANELGYVHIYSKAWNAEDEDVVAFLKAATDPANGPVFVHCQHGADRTGIMIAAYRIVVQGWSKDDAIAEMTTGGHGFHAVWGNLVEYVRNLDVEAIRRKVDLDSRQNATRDADKTPAPSSGRPQ